MRYQDIELNDLCDLVATTAEAELLSRFRRVSATAKADGSLLTEADTAMQRSLIRELKSRWPGYEVLGEEMPPEQQRALLADSDAGLWVLDPLDGTSNFAAGLPLFGVSLALVVGGRVVLGLVYDPVARECFSAIAGQGAWLNGAPLRLACERSELSDCVALVDFKRLPATLACRLASDAPYRSQRSLGSVALDWCWLAAGRLQLYLHGAQRLWDYGAGGLVFAEAGGAGGRLTALDGDWQAGLTLDKRIGLAAANDRLLADWRAWINAS